MSTCYKYIENGVVLNEEQLINFILEKLKLPEFQTLQGKLLKANTPEEIVQEAVTEGAKYQHNEKIINEEGVTSNKYIGCNDYVEAIHKCGKEDLLLTPRMDDDERKEHSIQILMDENPDMTRTEAEASYDEQRTLEAINVKAGIYLHNIIHILLKNGENSKEYNELIAAIKTELLANDSKVLKGLTDLDTSVSYHDPDKAIQILTATAKEEIRVIESLCPEKDRKLLVTEAPLFLGKESGINLACSDGTRTNEYEGLIGIADFIIVKNDGTVIIGDFKVSSKPYTQWVQAKKNKVDYQLAMYRAILAQKGIPGNKIELYTLPIIMPKQKLSEMKVPDRFASGEEAAAVAMLGAIGGKGRSRLDWAQGDFSQNLRKLGIHPQIERPKNTNPDKIEAQIQEDFGNIMGDHASVKTLNKQRFIDDDLHIKYNDEGKQIGWYFTNYIDKDTEEVFSENKEDFTKEGGLIDEYLLKIQERSKLLGKTILDELKEFKKKGTTPDKQTWLRASKNIDLQKLMIQVFGKYSRPEWEIEDSFPELLEHNILLFKKKTSNGEMLVEAVIISDKLLDTAISINGQEVLIGKYATTEESRHITEFKPLNSNYGNVKSLELISVLNTLAKNNPETFKHVIFQNMTVINTVKNQKQDVDITRIIANFNFLCEKGGIENQFKAGNIKTVSTGEACMSRLQNILYDGQLDDKLKKILSNLEPNQGTMYQKAENIKKLLIQMQDAYPKFVYKDFKSHRDYDMNTMEDVVYLTLSMAYNYCKGVNVAFDGRITKYGLNVGEIFKILGMPFLANQSNVLKNGNISTGWAQGVYTASPQTSPSEIMRQLTAYYDLMYQNIRRDYLKQNRQVNAIVDPYLKLKTSTLGQLISSGNVKIWENLLVHDASGKVDKELKIKNPWSSENKLGEEDREFLKKILWEINKYLLPGIPKDYLNLQYKGNETKIDALQSVKEAKTSGKYFELPLCRADDFQRISTLSSSNLKKFFTAQIDTLRDSIDYRQVHSSRAEQLKQNKLTQMYNQYTMSNSERKSIIEHENNPYNFLFDLEKIANDVAFQHIRKNFFDDALMLTETTVAVMHYLQNTDSSTDFQPVLEAIEDQQSVSIQNKVPISDEFQDAAKAVSVLKKVNSALVLACRPLQFFKELTYGQFTNYSRAWALKFGSNALTFKSVFEANKVVWGQRLGQYGKFFGGTSLADFTLCEALNKTYGIANEDLNRLVDNSGHAKVGILNNASRWMYIANSAPDYYNRLTLFVAKMMQDGCFEAHSLDEYGNLIYDWKKDKRFSELAKHGLNSNYTGTEYLKQKALYRAMCEELEKGGEELITWDATKKQYILKDLPQAYTTSQRNSIKEVSDTAYGFYDHETKSLLNHKFFGLIFLQFQTFLSAKINLWFKAKPRTQGDNTSQGQFVVRKENGEIMYKRLITDTSGNLIRVDKVPESQLTPEEKGKLEPVMEWQGDYVEGLIYSIGGTLYDLFHLNWKGLAENKYRMANVKLAMHDLLLGVILFAILKFIFSKGTNKMKDIAPTQRILVRAMQDVGPQGLHNLSFEPSFVQTWTNVKNDISSLLFADDPDVLEKVSKRFGAARDFIWEED